MLDYRGPDFITWASALTEQLAAYNVPAPVEEQWVDWASTLLSSPQLSGQGLADPRGFGDWQAWAAQLVQDLHL